MNINYDNIHQAIAALNQCAKENENRQTDTGAVRVSDLCTDVAYFLCKVRQDHKQWQETKDGKRALYGDNDENHLMISEEWIEELRTKLDSQSKEDFEKIWKKYGADEKEEPVSEELEEAAIMHYADIMEYEAKTGLKPAYMTSFKAGAKWQKQQLMAKAFDFTKEHDTACVLASECLRNHGWFNRERDFNDLWCHLSCVDELFVGKFSGKTKVIVIKED